MALQGKMIHSEVDVECFSFDNGYHGCKNMVFLRDDCSSGRFFQGSILLQRRVKRFDRPSSVIEARQLLGSQSDIARHEIEYANAPILVCQDLFLINNTGKLVPFRKTTRSSLGGIFSEETCTNCPARLSASDRATVRFVLRTPTTCFSHSSRIQVMLSFEENQLSNTTYANLT